MNSGKKVFFGGAIGFALGVLLTAGGMVYFVRLVLTEVVTRGGIGAP